MQQTPKEKPDADDCEQPKEEHSYYYDDAHGYEEFDPDEDEADDEEDRSQD